MKSKVDKYEKLE
jgi:cyclin-dependent kinase